jgi:propionate CoA-transferase
MTEVARGIDVRRDIMEQMEFPPARIATGPAVMDEALFAA